MHTIEALGKVLTYDPKTGEFTWLIPTGRKGRLGMIAGNSSTRYNAIKFEGTVYLAHRLAWAFHFGRWPVQYLDHINGDAYDNRISNLREADAARNQHNRRKPSVRNKSGYLGVHKLGKKWAYSLRSAGKNFRRQGFDTPEAAYAAYLDCKRIVHADGCTL